MEACSGRTRRGSWGCSGIGVTLNRDCPQNPPIRRRPNHLRNHGTGSQIVPSLILSLWDSATSYRSSHKGRNSVVGYFELMFSNPGQCRSTA
jgi:hypothetical protein